MADQHHRALFVKNLSYNVTPEELFDLFGKFGPIRQVRQGIANNTKGTAFVVYEDVMDAKQACDKLNGFNFQNRYLVGPSSMSSPKTSAAAAAAAASPSSKTAHRHDKLGVAGHETAPVTTHAAGVGSGRLLCSSRSAPPGSLSLCSHFLCLVVFGFSGARKKTSLTSLIESFTT
ncbi:hypothetical protein VdG1_03013 [Verticillium dahliae VDG1]|nr:hypothetical protein VdG1_03013 [Verticillium dahliae VDG1]